MGWLHVAAHSIQMHAGAVFIDFPQCSFVRINFRRVPGYLGLEVGAACGVLPLAACGPQVLALAIRQPALRSMIVVCRMVN